jgi:hypothetical protein
VNRRFEGTYHFNLQGRKSAEEETRVWQMARQKFLAQLILYLKMEAIRFSETSVHAPTTWRYISEEGSIHNYRCENLKFYNFTFFAIYEFLGGNETEIILLDSSNS